MRTIQRLWGSWLRGRGRRRPRQFEAAGPRFEVLEARAFLSIVPLGPELPAHGEAIAALPDGTFVEIYEPDFSLARVAPFDEKGTIPGRMRLIHPPVDDLGYIHALQVINSGNLVVLTDRSNTARIIVIDLHGRIRSDLLVDGADASAELAVNARGDVAIVWTESLGAIRVSRFNSEGQQIGGRPLIDDPENDPALALDHRGRMLAAFVTGKWQHVFSDAAVVVQRFTADGEKSGPPVRVAKGRRGLFLEFPSIAVDPEGNFVVGWSVAAEGRPLIRYMVQKFDAHGTPKGRPVVAVRLSRPLDIMGGQVAMAADGSFFVLVEFRDWSGGTPHPSGGLVKAFGAGGSLRGSLKVTGVDGRARHFSIAAGPGGRFVLGWFEHERVKRVYAVSGQKVGVRIAPWEQVVQMSGKWLGAGAILGRTS
jgi:hypothetical protein